MWLINSSIGRKLVMSITGLALVLFLFFHGTMNLVAIISPDSYNAICHFLGANWYALVGTVALAALVFLHFIYAIILTLQNYKARGNVRYAASDSQVEVEWSSKNMFALGIIVVGFLLLHLYNFWFKMQFVELTGIHTGPFDPTDGVSYIVMLFSNPVYSVLYLVWLGALWFHLTHGIWSGLQTFGWSNQIWHNRIKCVSNIIATIVVLMFVAVVVYFGVSAICSGTTELVW